MMPSRSRSRLASSSAAPSPSCQGPHEPVRSGLHGLVEEAAPVAEGQAREVLAVQLEEVEQHVGDGRAAAQQLEARPALVVEGDELAVEHGLAAVEPAPEAGQLDRLAVTSMPLELYTLTVSPSITARERKPSHLIS